MIPLGQPVNTRFKRINGIKNQKGYLHRRHQAVHVVSSVAVVTEKKLVIVLRGAAQGASLALDALPRILPHADQHVSRELQTCWMAY